MDVIMFLFSDDSFCLYQSTTRSSCLSCTYNEVLIANVRHVEF
jgi:hypothetical protein